MKMTCEKAALEKALGLAARAAAAKSVVPILECVLLTAGDGGARLYATDSQISLETARFRADVEEAGSVALDARTFADMVRTLRGDSVSVSVDGRHRAAIRGDRTSSEMPGLAGEGFPTLDEGEFAPGAQGLAGPFRLGAAALKDMVRQTIFSVSHDHTKPVLTGELMEIRDGLLRMVAIDMFRISYRAEAVAGPRGAECRAVVPAKALGELMRALGGEDGAEVEFSFGKEKAAFATDDFRLYANLLSGEFIKYEQIFNDDFSTKATVAREEFLGSCDRVLKLGDGKPLTMRLSVAGGELAVRCQTDRALVDDAVPCEREGAELEIYFNPRYFSEALRALDSERVELRFNSVLSPATVGAEGGGPNQRYLIVPLRPPS